MTPKTTLKTTLFDPKKRFIIIIKPGTRVLDPFARIRILTIPNQDLRFADSDSQNMFLRNLFTGYAQQF